MARQVTVGGPGNLTPPFENVIKAAQRSEQLGYDVIWYYDHLMSWWPQSIWSPDLVAAAKLQYSPHIHLDAVATMAVVGASTERVALGTSVTDAARRPAAMLAQEFLTLDHITKGRAILGIGAGEACNLEPYGIPFDRPISRMEEAIKIIRLLWSNDGPVDFDGQFWQLRGAVVGLRPYQPGCYPPIWIGGVADRTLQIVGRLADGWLPVVLDPERYAERTARIRQAANDAGRDPDAITYGLWCYVVVDESHEECHRMLETPLVKDLCLARSWDDYERYGYKHPLGERAAGFKHYIPSLVPRERALDLINGVPFGFVHDYMFHGTPEEIAERCRQFVDAGASHLALQNITFAADSSKVGSSFRLVAELARLLKGLTIREV